MREPYWCRVCKSKDYKGIIHVIAIGHYIKKASGEDECSKNCFYFYKYGSHRDFFLKKFLDIFNTHFKNDSLQFDFVSLCPTSKKHEFNENMLNLVKDFANTIGIEYKPLLTRNRAIESSHGLKYDERYQNTQGSIDVIGNPTHKNILLFDNISTTGTTFLESYKVLSEKGARTIIGLCLALSDKKKENDYDLNQTLKISKILSCFKGPKVPKELYEEYQRSCIKEWKKKN